MTTQTVGISHSFLNQSFSLLRNSQLSRIRRSSKEITWQQRPTVLLQKLIWRGLPRCQLTLVQLFWGTGAQWGRSLQQWWCRRKRAPRSAASRRRSARRTRPREESGHPCSSGGSATRSRNDRNWKMMLQAKKAQRKKSQRKNVLIGQEWSWQLTAGVRLREHSSGVVRWG